MQETEPAFGGVLGYQRGVITRAQALAGGVTADGLRHRTRPGGPWQRVLPGVYLTATGQPTGEQQEIGAMLYAGPDCVLTGPAALRRYGIRAPQSASVDVLVPVNRGMASRGFVVIHRTRRMPATARARAS